MLKLTKLLIIFKLATIVNLGKVLFPKDIVINLQMKISLELLIVIKLITIMIGLVEISKKLVRMTLWSMIILLKWSQIRSIWVHREKMNIKIYLKVKLKLRKIHIELLKKWNKIHSEFRIHKMNFSTVMDPILLNKTKLKKKNKHTW